MLSCLAAMQGAILLIAARRSDQISAELANHDHQTNLEAAEMIKALQEMTDEIRRHVVPGEDLMHRAYRVREGRRNSR